MLYLQDYIKYQQASERQVGQRAAGLDLNAADQGVYANSTTDLWFDAATLRVGMRFVYPHHGCAFHPR